MTNKQLLKSAEKEFSKLVKAERLEEAREVFETILFLKKRIQKGG